MQKRVSDPKLLNGFRGKPRRTTSSQTHKRAGRLNADLPSGVRYVDASQVDALAAHDEERGEAEERHAAADHGQLGRLPGAQLQLLDDVAPQHDAHAGAGHDDETCGGGRQRKRGRLAPRRQ